jgi:hypothetical protein
MFRNSVLLTSQPTITSRLGSFLTLGYVTSHATPIEGAGEHTNLQMEFYQNINL